MDAIIYLAGDRVRECMTGDTYRVRMVADDGDLMFHGEQGWHDPEDYEPAGSNGFDVKALPCPRDQQEALSVTLSITHLVREDHPKGELVMPLLFSTAVAQDVLLNQIPYFVKTDGADNIASDMAHVAAIASGFGGDVMYVYSPCPRVTNIIMDHAVFSRFVDLGGSVMGGCAAAIQEADVMLENYSRRGGDTTLMVFVPGEEWYQDELNYVSTEEVAQEA